MCAWVVHMSMKILKTEANEICMSFWAKEEEEVGKSQVYEKKQTFTKQILAGPRRNKWDLVE